MKKIMFLLACSLIIVSCASVKNYDQESEMNNLYPIEMVYFDDKTSEDLGDFPVPRKIYADLIQKIELQNPKYVILKFLFDLEKPDDNILFEEINKYDNVLTEATTSISPENKLLSILSINIEINDIKINDYPEILLPNKTLITGFSGIGLADFDLDKNEYHDFPAISMVNGKIYPSLAVLIANNIINNDISYNSERIYWGEKYVEIPDGKMRIDLSEPKKLYKAYSMIDILNGNEEYNFENKIVIIFIESPEVRIVKSKYDGLHNKAEIVADSINTILKRIE